MINDQETLKVIYYTLVQLYFDVAWEGLGSRGGSLTKRTFSQDTYIQYSHYYFIYYGH